MSEPLDDFDLEVSPLARASASVEGDERDASSTPDDEEPNTPPTRHVSVAARRPRTLQRLRAGSAIALLILLATAILFVPTSNRDAFFRMLTAPTPLPIATPLAGADAFLWQHSVPWGQLLIDGKLVPDVRVSATQQDAHGLPQSPAFHLSRGRHALDYRAYPFPTLACAVSVPASRDDTCPLANYTDFAFLAPNAPLTRLLDLQATIDRLPKAQVDVLLATTQTYLTSLASALPSGALAIGDHFLDQTGQVTRATSAMRIAPQFRLNSSVEQHDGVRCVTLCTATGIGEASSAEGWALLAPVALTWRYTTPAGQEVISDGPAFPIGAMPFNTIPLRVGWSDGAWQKPRAVFGAAQTDPVICPTGEHALSVVQLPTEGLHYQWPVAASTADLGCLYAGSEMDVVTGAPSSPMALVLYRAGALIAVNEQAHQIFPKLPLASAHEAALALAVAPTHLS